MMRARNLFWIGLVLCCNGCADPVPPLCEHCDGGTEVVRRDDYGYPLDAVLRINQIQMEGTHNSYHIASEGAIDYLDYTLPPLDTQLSADGVRQFELDIQYKADTDDFHVLHAVFFDELSHCDLLVDCLQDLKDFSDANPGHHPLMVHIEPKESIPLSQPGILDRIDAAILAVWPRELLVVPDDVQRDEATVLAGIQQHGWPTLGAARGKALFIMLDKAEARTEYTHGLQHTKGRVMFAEGATDGTTPFAVFARIDEPRGNTKAIQDAVARGYMVRTRADGEPGPPDSYERFEAALASGAQMISTNFPQLGFHPDYAIVIPDGTPSRCNPVNAPAECTSKAVESPARLR